MLHSSGELWAGTDNGLARFDPVQQQFETFTPHPNDPGKNVIRALYEDGDQNIWVGTRAALCLLLSDGTFKLFTHDPSNANSLGEGAVRAIHESEGDLWIGTEQGGVTHWDRATNVFTRFDMSNSGMSSNFVRDVTTDRFGNLWIATFTGGVMVLDVVSGEFTNYDTSNSNLIHDRVLDLLVDNKQRIWIGSNQGLQTYSYENETFESVHFVHRRESYERLNVRQIYQDRGGVIWVSTEGAFKFNPDLAGFAHHRTSPTYGDGVSDNEITSFVEEVNGDVWIGTVNALNRWDKDRDIFYSYSRESAGLSDDRVMSLEFDRAGRLWAGTFAKGIAVFEEGNLVAEFDHDPADPRSIAGSGVSKILLDSSGRIWLSAYGAGVSSYVGDGKFQNFPSSSLPEHQFDLRTLDLVEHEGEIWIATEGGGVAILEPTSGSVRHLRHNRGDTNSISSDQVMILLKTQDSIWIGTRDAGVNRYDLSNGEIERVTKKDGLSSNGIYGILQDQLGRIWMSGGKGISVYDPHNKNIVTYDTTDGLQGNDFNSLAYYQLRDGTMLFGGDNGFNAFDPLRVSRNPHKPPVIISKFTRFNKEGHLEDQPVYFASQLNLAHDDYVVGFEFAALDFTAPEKNEYMYQMVGINDDWVHAGNERQATYANLEPGNYTFRVKASNNSGVWNEEGASLDIWVAPPAWATWWAFLIYAALIAAMLAFSYRYYSRRLVRQAERRYSERLQLYIESLEEATDCILIADADRQLIYANAASTDILGIDTWKSMGQPLLGAIFEQRGDANLAYMGLLAEERWHGEVDRSHKDRVITIDVTISAAKNARSEMVAFISIIRDITDRKRTEAELNDYRKNLEELVAERTSDLNHEIEENKQIQVDLAKSLEEKELLLKEVHHRVKNNMQVISSLLNIQAEGVEDEVFIGLLGESQQRIKSMALIHENLYQSDNLLSIDFEDYIDMLANSLCRFYTVPGASIFLDINVSNVHLDIETAVPLGLIINELISNSLKHAFKGRQDVCTITVSFSRSGCVYHLTIGDDGIGVPDDFDLENTSSMGLEIVFILTEQIEGQIQFDNTRGTTFEINFPGKVQHA